MAARGDVTRTVIRGAANPSRQARQPLTSCAKARIIAAAAARLSQTPLAHLDLCLPNVPSSTSKRPERTAAERELRCCAGTPPSPSLEPVAVFSGVLAMPALGALTRMGTSRPLEENAGWEWHPHASERSRGHFALPTLQLSPTLPIVLAQLADHLAAAVT